MHIETSGVEPGSTGGLAVGRLTDTPYYLPFTLDSFWGYPLVYQG